MDNNVQKISDRRGLAIASLVLGIVGTIAMFINISIGSSSVHFVGSLGIISLPALIIGLILGIFGIKSSKKTFSIVGIVLCVIGLLFIFVFSTMRVSGPTITTSNTQ